VSKKEIKPDSSNQEDVTSLDDLSVHADPEKLLVSVTGEINSDRRLENRKVAAECFNILLIKFKEEPEKLEQIFTLIRIGLKDEEESIRIIAIKSINMLIKRGQEIEAIALINSVLIRSDVSVKEKEVIAPALELLRDDYPATYFGCIKTIDGKN